MINEKLLADSLTIYTSDFAGAAMHKFNTTSTCNATVAAVGYIAKKCLPPHLSCAVDCGFLVAQIVITFSAGGPMLIPGTCSIIFLAKKIMLKC
jgi:hypothetical protein